MNKKDLKWLYLDFNSYFATIEQQINPSIRKKAVAIVPSLTDYTCAIAASNEAKKLGVDLSKVQASATDGTVRKSDVQAHIKNSSRPAPEKHETFTYEPIGEGERVPLTGMRRVISNRMHSSLQSMAQLTLHLDVEMDDAISLRKEMKSGDVVPGYTDFVIASVAQALKVHPQLNSQMLENEILQLTEINIKCYNL